MLFFQKIGLTIYYKTYCIRDSYLHVLKIPTGEASVLNLQNPLIALPLFLFLILCVALWKSWVKVSFSVLVKYPHIKECLLTHNPEPAWFKIKSCFSTFICRSNWKIFTSNGWQFWLALLSKFAVRFRKSLCRIVTNLSLLQLIAYWMLNIFAQQQHVDGIFGRTQPYLSLRLSHNCYFDRSNPWPLIGYDVNQLETPFSRLIEFKCSWFSFKRFCSAF